MGGDIFGEIDFEGGLQGRDGCDRAVRDTH